MRNAEKDQNELDIWGGSGITEMLVKTISGQRRTGTYSGSGQLWFTKEIAGLR